jgi:hypothetical protein
MFVFVHNAALLQTTSQMTTNKQQLWWRRGNNGSATNGKQQLTHAQHVLRWTSNDGSMRWRTTAAEEIRRMEQRTSN